MTDPIAEAAAQKAAAQNQSTTTPYPNAAGGASPEGTSSPADSAHDVSGSEGGEPGNGAAAGLESISAAIVTSESNAQESLAAGGEAGEPGNVSSAQTSSIESVPTSQPTSIESSGTEQGNAVEAAASASAASDSLPNSAQGADGHEQATAGGEDPNVAAQSAASPLESAITSSVSAVSHVSGIVAGSVSDDVKRARVAIDHLRAHLWTFTGDAVANLHAELDKLEAFFK